MRSYPLITAWGLIAWGSIASAQQAPREGASPAVELSRQRLVRDAEEARAAGDHARALDLATRAGQLRMSPSLRLLLAQEHNALGHSLDALQLASQCASEARNDPAVAHRERVLATCEALADALRRRVGHVIVRVPADVPPSLEVSIQGGSLPRPLWGVDYPVVPGSVVVEASDAQGTFRRELSVGEGATELVDVTLTPRPTRVPEPTAASPEAPIAPPPSPSPPPPPPPSPPPPLSPPQGGAGATPWVVTGAGAAVLGAGLGFFFARGGALDDRERVCPMAICRSVNAVADARVPDDRAALFNLLTNVSLAVGTTAVVAGVTWYLVARLRGAPAARSALRLNVTPSAAGALVGVEGAL